MAAPLGRRYRNGYDSIVARGSGDVPSPNSKERSAWAQALGRGTALLVADGAHDGAQGLRPWSSTQKATRGAGGGRKLLHNNLTLATQLGGRRAEESDVFKKGRPSCDASTA